MPTNDERREVAARLREHQHGDIVFPTFEGGMIASWLRLKEALGAEGCNPQEDHIMMFGYLADLIEPEPINGETSDGYHTFNELYHHRALLFSVIVRNYPELCWKSKKHHTGDMYEGMFIVGINTPDGQASYHYDINPYWDMFECEELEFAPEWDGHTPDQAIERIGKLTCHEPELERTCKPHGTWEQMSQLQEFRKVLCDCGYELGTDMRFGYPIKIVDYCEKPNYCPNCGVKILKSEK